MDNSENKKDFSDLNLEFTADEMKADQFIKQREQM
ncbi:hypothetical protein EZS27_011744 [termite gut metagenome]|uniref:Uncharacterized protein n=1 Tax=termite gut metagenome TaxID=433724 RepID=A0A5J4S4X2_9ZZZZ